jgi:hypothetical protein
MHNTNLLLLNLVNGNQKGVLAGWHQVLAVHVTMTNGYLYPVNNPVSTACSILLHKLLPTLIVQEIG